MVCCTFLAARPPPSMFAALASLQAVPSWILQSLEAFRLAFTQLHLAYAGMFSIAVIQRRHEIQTSAALFQGSPQYRIGGLVGEPSRLQCYKDPPHATDVGNRNTATNCHAGCSTH